MTEPLHPFDVRAHKGLTHKFCNPSPWVSVEHSHLMDDITSIGVYAHLSPASARALAADLNAAADEAERTLNLADEVAALDAAGVLHAVRGVCDLDEAPGAYKDIETVMANQTDLTEIVTTLRPLAVVKG